MTVLARLRRAYFAIEAWTQRWRWWVIVASLLLMAANHHSLANLWHLVRRQFPILALVATILEASFWIGLLLLATAAGIKVRQLGWRFWRWRKQWQQWVRASTKRWLLMPGYYLNWVGAVFGPTGVTLALGMWLAHQRALLFIPLLDIVSSVMARMALRPRFRAKAPDPVTSATTATGEAPLAGPPPATLVPEAAVLPPVLAPFAQPAPNTAAS